MTKSFARRLDANAGGMPVASEHEAERLEARLEEARERRARALKGSPPNNREPSRPWEQETTAVVVPWPGPQPDPSPISKREFSERLDALKEKATAPALGAGVELDTETALTAPATASEEPRPSRRMLAGVCALALLPVLGYLAVPSQTALTPDADVASVAPAAIDAPMSAASSEVSPSADSTVGRPVAVSSLSTPETVAISGLAVETSTSPIAGISIPDGASPVAGTFADPALTLRSSALRPTVPGLSEPLPSIAGGGIAATQSVPSARAPATDEVSATFAAVTPVLPQNAMTLTAGPMADGAPALPAALGLPEVSTATATLAAVTNDVPATPPVSVSAAAPTRIGPVTLTSAEGDRAFVPAGIIAPFEPLRVTILMPDQADPEVAATFGVAVAKDGHDLSTIKPVPYTISTSNLRYFHPEDAAAAQELADLLGVTARDFTTFRPSPSEGSVELWVNGTARPAPQPVQQRIARAPSAERQIIIVQPTRVVRQTERRGPLSGLAGLFGQDNQPRVVLRGGGRVVERVAAPRVERRTPSPTAKVAAPQSPTAKVAAPQPPRAASQPGTVTPERVTPTSGPTNGGDKTSGKGKSAKKAKKEKADKRGKGKRSKS